MLLKDVVLKKHFDLTASLDSLTFKKTQASKETPIESRVFPFEMGHLVLCMAWRSGITELFRLIGLIRIISRIAFV